MVINSQKKFSTKDLAKSFEIIFASSLLTERFKLWMEEKEELIHIQTIQHGNQSK